MPAKNHTTSGDKKINEKLTMRELGNLYQGVGVLNCDSCERMARAEEAIENSEKRVESMEKKLDKFQYWFMGLMGTSILSLLLLVVNMLDKKG